MEYYGEDVGTVVLEAGSTTLKCGYAGDISPTISVPMAAGLVKEHSKIYTGHKLDLFLNQKNIGSLEIIEPVQSGIIKNWELFETICKDSLMKEMKLNPKEHPLIFSEGAETPKAQREKTVETVFEHLQFDSVFLAKQPVLSCFAVGRYSGLVLDMAAAETRCVPVCDGYVLPNEIKREPLGGNTIDRVLKSRLAQKGVRLVEDVVVIRNPSVLSYVEKLILRDIKENFCLVGNNSENQKVELKEYKLPDGKLIQIMPEDRTFPPEILFSPEIPPFQNLTEKNATGIPNLIINTISACDPELRKVMVGNVIVSGKAFLMKGFYKRLFSAINDKIPPALSKLKIITPNDSIRRTFEVSWIGGSILGSLGTLKQLLITRADYEESGASIVHEKCP